MLSGEIELKNNHYYYLKNKPTFRGDQLVSNLCNSEVVYEKENQVL